MQNSDVAQSQWLTPKGPRNNSFKMTNSIDHIVKNTNSDGSKFISPELVKIIACVGKEKKIY